MFFNFDNISSEFNSHVVTFEIYIGEQLVNKQTIEAPEIMLKNQFIQMMQQIANDNRPMKCRLIVPDVIWNNYEKKQKVLENYVEFRNKLMEG